jgi:hypothetical protein
VWAVAAPGPSTSHHDFSKADLKVTSLAQVELETLVERWGSREEKQ